MPAMQWRDRAHQSDGMPEPPFKKRKLTVLDHTEEASRIVFNKTISGKYRSGDSGFDEVGVLLITWVDDDLYCRDSEVPRLQSIFEDQFGYKVETYQIPSERSATGLARQLADFAYRYDSPSKMAIVYYGGHGEFVEGRLQLFAKQDGDGDGDPTTFFDDAVFQLKLPDTDILVIIDCCFAARAFSRAEIGRRKFELMTACPPLQVSPSPGSDKSFTKIVCDKLEKLIKECPDGFTTAKLYRHVYHQVSEDFRKPLLFDQSPFDYGKIHLKPFKRQQPASTDGKVNGQQVFKKPHYFVDLSLRMEEMPTPLMMNQLASALQYLPKVTEVKFKKLHAPEGELQDFMTILLRINHLRPLLRKLRARRAEKKRRELCKDIEQCNPECEHCPQHLHSSLHKKQSISAFHDWGNSKLEKIENENTLTSSVLTSLEPINEGLGLADVVIDSSSSG